MKSKYKNRNIDDWPWFQDEATFDFHEFDQLTSFDIEKKLKEFLEISYSEGKNSVLVITGKGMKVRPMVFRLLQKSERVKEFKQAGYHNGQNGAFEVILC